MSSTTTIGEKMTAEERIRRQYEATAYILKATAKAQDEIRHRHPPLNLKDHPYSQTAQAFNALEVDEAEAEADRRREHDNARRRDFSDQENTLYPAYIADSPQDTTAAFYGSGNSDSTQEEREYGTSPILARRYIPEAKTLLRSSQNRLRHIDDYADLTARKEHLEKERLIRPMRFMRLRHAGKTLLITRPQQVKTLGNSQIDELLRRAEK